MFQEEVNLPLGYSIKAEQGTVDKIFYSLYEIGPSIHSSLFYHLLQKGKVSENFW